MYKGFITIILLAIMVLVSCEGKINEIDNIEIPKSNVSFSEHLKIPIERKCAAYGCHDLETAAAGYQLIGYHNITQPGLVDKTSPETSLLVWVINGTSPVQMPPIGALTAPLTKAQVDGIITWIREGALDN